MLTIEIERAGYGAGLALHDIHIEVRDGAVTGVLGANGAGKTTLLRAIAGLQPPLVSGSIRFDGVELVGSPAHARAAQGVAHVPEGRRVFSSMSVRDNLLTGGFASRRDRSMQLISLLDRFPELARRLDQSAGSLSGGEQQMLAIGRALMARPRLLMLDEPSLGLAPVVVDRVFQLLAELTVDGDMALLLIEQNAHQALDLIDEACVLRRGRVVARGTADELRQSEGLASAYFGA